VNVGGSGGGDGASEDDAGEQVDYELDEFET
jgi:hypothetical protein